MTMMLVHQLHDARDRILRLKQQLEEAQIRELPAYQSFLEAQIQGLDEALVKARIPDRYRVAVVGRFKVGKSSFVNKLLGSGLASVDTNPETAAISVFRYDKKTWAEVEFISTEEWEKLKADHEDDPQNEGVKRFDQFIRFNDRPAKKDKDGREVARQVINLDEMVREWVIPGGKRHILQASDWMTADGQKAFRREIKRFTTSSEPLHYLVNKLIIHAPIDLLRDQIELVDTPGLGDTERFRVQLTEDLMEDVDAILFLTTSGASYSQDDKDFILNKLRKRQIKHLQLIVTKCDETYENAKQDARDQDEDPPTFPDFKAREISRVRNEARGTLDELLELNNISEEDGYYFIEQLQDVPVHLVSKKFHDDGDIEKGGIDAVRDALYTHLSTSHRFCQAKSTLETHLDATLERLGRSARERLSTLEHEFDPSKVRQEIEAIRISLNGHLDAFGGALGEDLGLLSKDQEAFFRTLSPQLEVICLKSAEVLRDAEMGDLAKHWKTQRCGYWGYLHNLQSRIADRAFPRVELLLNELGRHLDGFLEATRMRLAHLQGELTTLEARHELSGIEPIALDGIIEPVLADITTAFQAVREAERDSLIKNLDDFITEKVKGRLDQAKRDVSIVRGTGSVRRQGDEISSFYATVRNLLIQALQEDLQGRIQSFAETIRLKAETVGPRVQAASERLLQQRLSAIESTIQIANTGQKAQVTAYLKDMLILVSNFGVDTEALPFFPSCLDLAGEMAASGLDHSNVQEVMSERHYTIEEGQDGYPYERIFRPYMDQAKDIYIEDPYIRLTHQFDNLMRFLALVVRVGGAERVHLYTGPIAEGLPDGDRRLDSISRDLETHDIKFIWQRDPNLHNREIRFDDAWTVKLDRGLDIYKKPASWDCLEATDFTLRRCKRVKVDVFAHSPVTV